MLIWALVEPGNEGLLCRHLNFCMPLVASVNLGKGGPGCGMVPP